MIPGEIKIGAHTWSVELEDIKDHEVNGLCRKESRKISLEKSLDDVSLRQTLLHEVLHAVCYAAGVQDSEQLTEEQFVMRVTYLLDSVLIENKLY